MDLIFKNNTELKKEYQILHRNILPSLNKCGNCNKIKCNYSLNFSVNCWSCIRDKCQNCFEFNRSKDILINTTDAQISNYVSNFLSDYFNVRELLNQFFKTNITEEVKEKDPHIFTVGRLKKFFAIKKKKQIAKFYINLKVKNANFI